MPKAILEVDTIEAMRKHIEALQAENDQLQAQVASGFEHEQEQSWVKQAKVNGLYFD